MDKSITPMGWQCEGVQTIRQRENRNTGLLPPEGGKASIGIRENNFVVEPQTTPSPKVGDMRFER
jgi:hypothetical protein